MEKQDLTPRESLSVINEMISTARSRLNENGYIYRFWGWLIFVCALAQFVLFKLEFFEYNYFPYLLLLPAGIYTWVKESRRHRQQRGSYINSVMTALWIPLAANLAIVGFLIWPVFEISPTPFLLIFLAIGAIVSGGTIKFTPLIWGGILCNAIGIAAFFAPWLYHPLLLAAGIVAADLIPGYMIKNKHHKQHA